MRSSKEILDYAIRFTEMYRSEPDKVLREAKVLELQVPAVLTGIREDDLIVGGMEHMPIGFSPQYGGAATPGCAHTYFYYDNLISNALEDVRVNVDEGYAESTGVLQDFWRREQTKTKIEARFFAQYGTRRCSSVQRGRWAVARISGVTLDMRDWEF